MLVPGSLLVVIAWAAFNLVALYYLAADRNHARRAAAVNLRYPSTLKTCSANLAAGLLAADAVQGGPCDAYTSTGTVYA